MSVIIRALVVHLCWLEISQPVLVGNLSTLQEVLSRWFAKPVASVGELEYNQIGLVDLKHLLLAFLGI